MILQIFLTQCNYFADWQLILVIIGNRIKYNHFLHQRTLVDDLANLRQLLLAHYHIARLRVLNTEQ